MLENIVLVVPPAIELVFSFTLAVTSASVEGRKRWILVLDGLSFFLLSLADLLAHIIRRASSSVHVFSIIDTTVAAASLLPLLFYTLFLFLYARTTLIAFLPSRFSRVATFSLFSAIPLTLATNEISSLIGIAHVFLPAHNEVGVGFSSYFTQRVSLFFSASCLALLTLFQALLFTVSFVRLARGFLEERRIEAAKQDPEAREEVHLFRGLGWLAVGLKLGAIETVVGFASTSFAVVITRRTLRLFARGSLIIGVIKGLNTVEDITGLESDLRARSLSTRRKLQSRRFSRFMISNPRNSTFQQLSPEASSFHIAQSAKREKRDRIGPSPLALGSGSNLARLDNMDIKKAELRSPSFESPAFDDPVSDIFPRSNIKPNQRVTVHYDGRTPPVLQMRFSVVDLQPLPPFPPGHSHAKGHVHDTRPQSAPQVTPNQDEVPLPEREWDQQLFYGGYVPSVPKTAPLPPRPPRDSRRISHVAPSITNDVAMPFQDSLRPSLDSHRSSVSRDMSGGNHRARSVSMASDSLSVVREIAARFPGLPPRVVPGKAPMSSRTAGATQPLLPPPGLQDDADADSDAEWRALSRARSLKRRQEMEAQRMDAWDGDNARTDLSPQNSINRKPVPPSAAARVDNAVSEVIIARAAVTARAARSENGPRDKRGRRSSLEDPSSYYSSSSDDDTINGEFSYTVRNADSEAETGTLGPWTPATTVAATPGIKTPGSWIEERPGDRLPRRTLTAGQGEYLDAYSSAQAQVKPPPQSRSQQKQPQSKQQPRLLPKPGPSQRDPAREGATLEERRRLRRLSLLRRELRASAHDSATANAALEPELQAPWLHTDPLTQLQTMGSGPLHFGDEDEDAVLDDAWRRAGLSRIKSVNRVRVHTTPRAEHGFEVRGSLVAVEEEDEEVDLGVMEQEQERRASASTLKKPARLDSGVLGEDDRKLIRQGIRV